MKHACLTDWNCRLAAHTTPREAADAITEQAHRYGISRFCCVFDFDCTRESVALHLGKRDRKIEAIRALLPSRISVSAASAPITAPGLSELRELLQLGFPSKSSLFLSMPLVSYRDDFDRELHLLLHKKRLRPVFLSFEHCMTLYPSEIVEKLLRIPLAGFQFGLRSLTDPHVREVMEHLLRNGQTVLLGTGLHTPEKLFFAELDHALDTAKASMHPFLYERLRSRNEAFAPSVWR